MRRGFRPGAGVVRELEADQVAYRRLTRISGERRVHTAERIGLAAVTTLLAANTLRVAYGLWVRQDLRATLIGRFGWLALTPSLRSYEAFERRIADAFVSHGRRLHRASHEKEIVRAAKATAASVPGTASATSARIHPVLLWGVLGAVLGIPGTTVGLALEAGVLASVAWLTLQFLNGRNAVPSD